MRFSELRRSGGSLLLIGSGWSGPIGRATAAHAELSRISIRAARPEIESDLIGPLNPIHLITLVLPNFWADSNDPMRGTATIRPRPHFISALQHCC